MPNLKHLYYFHVFAHELSLTRAAERLGISAPALSNQLKELESSLGIALTRRLSGKFIVTEPGEMVLHYADRMFALYEELRGKLSSARALKGSLFRVGLCQYLGARFSFDLLELIVRSDLSLSRKISVTYDSSDRLVAGLAKDHYDLAVGAVSTPPSETSTLITQTIDFPVRLFAPSTFIESQDVTRKDRRTHPDSLIELANSQQVSLVFPARPSVLRDEIDRFLAGREISPAKVIECNSCSAIVQLIERGLAIGFVPIPCLLDFKSAASLMVLGPAKGYWRHGVSVLTQKGEQRVWAKVSPLADMFSSEAVSISK